MFRIKICGVTTAKDVQLAALAGADAVGLNFVPTSPRFVAPEAIAEIVAKAPAKVALVGVFADEEPGKVLEIAKKLPLAHVQLHGDEPPETIALLADLHPVKAFRCPEGLAPVLAYLAECRVPPEAVLVDAFVDGQLGGTGQTANWAAIAADRGQLGTVPLILAGGLLPFNVAEAIEQVRPDAVDTASGVESAPGRKDPMMVRAFVNAAKKAFSS